MLLLLSLLLGPPSPSPPPAPPTCSCYCLSSWVLPLLLLLLLLLRAGGEEMFCRRVEHISVALSGYQRIGLRAVLRCVVSSTATVSGTGLTEPSQLLLFPSVTTATSIRVPQEVGRTVLPRYPNARVQLWVFPQE
jgi:hypothetical protein